MGQRASVAPGVPAPCGAACGVGAPSRLAREQLEVLQRLVYKHVGESELTTLAGDFSRTATERGIQRWEQPHLVAALDILNAYQQDRRARLGCDGGAGNLPSVQRAYAEDPRTRFVEFLKRWLRTHAGSDAVQEDDVRSMCGLCREVMHNADLFPSRNPVSFMQTVAGVYEHFQLQLREVLERDRSCAELAQRALSLGRNLVSDLLAYLLVAPTSLRQTDALASLEVVALWQSLPNEGRPVPCRADPVQQKRMREAWATLSGTALASVLRSRGCVRLFQGIRVDGDVSEALAIAAASGEKDSFEQKDLKRSGLAGAFRRPEHEHTRKVYVNAIRGVSDIIYMLGEALVLFHRVSDGMGDYGMIRVGPWLHPVLDALVLKLKRLRSDLEELNTIIEETYVLSRARGLSVDGLAPSNRMCARAHSAWERAIGSRGAHINVLVQALDELKIRSAPERLPQVVEGLSDTCKALQSLIKSPDFIARVGSLPTLYCEEEKRSDMPVVDRDCTPRLRALADSPEHPGEEDSSTTPGSSEDEMSYEVERLAQGCHDPRCDRRVLAVTSSRLKIYEKGSSVSVKTDVSLADGIEYCTRESSDVVSFVIRRLPRGAQEQDGVVEYKPYAFRFSTTDAAIAFHHKLVSSMVAVVHSN